MMSTETLLEHKLLHSHKKEMIVFLNKHPEYFDEAVELAIQNKQPYSWRAAWVLWSYISKNDIRIRNHIPKLIKAIRNKADGHQRELLKILLEMNLNEEEEGYLFDLCVSLWEDVEKKPSIRYTAFRFIIKMAIKHPELSNEILLLAQDKYLNSLSPGVHRSIKKMMTNTIALNHDKR